MMEQAAANLRASVHLEAGTLLSIHHFGVALAAGQGLHDPYALQPVPGVRCARQQALRKGAARPEVPCAKLDLLCTVKGVAEGT